MTGAEGPSRPDPHAGVGFAAGNRTGAGRRRRRRVRRHRRRAVWLAAHRRRRPSRPGSGWAGGLMLAGTTSCSPNHRPGRQSPGPGHRRRGPDRRSPARHHRSPSRHPRRRRQLADRPGNCVPTNRRGVTGKLSSRRVAACCPAAPTARLRAVCRASRLTQILDWLGFVGRGAGPADHLPARYNRKGGGHRDHSRDHPAGRRVHRQNRDPVDHRYHLAGHRRDPAAAGSNRPGRRRTQALVLNPRRQRIELAGGRPDPLAGHPLVRAFRGSRAHPGHGPVDEMNVGSVAAEPIPDPTRIPEGFRGCVDHPAGCSQPA